MMKFIPIIALILGAGAGAFGGLSLQPADGESQMESQESKAEKETEADLGDASDLQFIKLNNQFIVPVISNESVTSVVVVTLGLEVASGETTQIFSAEPKLRDAFLQVLFDHANIGGFEAEFTNARNLSFLREALTATAQDVLGVKVVGVLITDLARQDI